MKQYKTVAAPATMSVNRKNSHIKAVEAYASIINKEAMQGWELEMIQQIPLIDEPGCLASLFGKTAEITYTNMLIFSKNATKISDFDSDEKDNEQVVSAEDTEDNAETSDAINEEKVSENDANVEEDWGHGLDYKANPASPELIDEYNRLYEELNNPMTSIFKKSKIQKRIDEIRDKIWS